MTLPLTRLWKTLDREPVLAGVDLEWRGRLGEEYNAAKRFLRPETTLSAAYPCPWPSGEDCPRRVIVHGDDDIVAVCGNERTGCEPKKLRRQDIVVWRFDLDQFAAALGELLGCRGKVRKIGAERCRYRLGEVSAAPSVRIPLYFAIPDATGSLNDLLAAGVPSPALVVVPLNESLSDEAIELLETRKFAALSGSDLVARNNAGGLIATDGAALEIRDFVRRLTGTRTPDTTLAVPPGTNWVDITIEFIDRLNIRVTTGNESRPRKFRYSQLGMIDRRTKRPNQQWKLLWQMSRCPGGVLTWDTPDAKRSRSKQVEFLRRHLRDLLPIPVDPIVLTEDGQGWVARFVLVAQNLDDERALPPDLEHRLRIENLIENDKGHLQRQHDERRHSR